MRAVQAGRCGLAILSAVLVLWYVRCLARTLSIGTCRQGA